KKTPLLCRWRVSCVLDESGRPVNFLISVARVAMNTEFHSSKIKERDGNLNLAGDEIDENQRESFLGRVEALAISASGFAHDFKNILTTIVANLSLVRESVTDDSILSGIDDALEASSKGKDLANDLLSQARGSRQSHREEKDIGELLTAAARMSTAGSGAHCEVFIQEGAWSANVNGSQIFQLINNLIINARHAMDDTGTIFANLKNIELTDHCVEGLEGEKYLQLEVIDHGCGISEENLGKIFNRLYTTKTSGSGLGLSNCQAITRDHGGVITVDSIKDRGTSFKVYLPATGTTEYAQKDHKENIIYSGCGSVLVVDDDDLIIDTSSKLLIALGYEVECANSGSESVTKYRRRFNTENSFAVVLMDMTMPGGIDGEEAAQQILDIDPNAKIISCSGYNSEDLANASESKGEPVFSGILSKPFDIQTISAKFREVINPVDD
ncbi:MAG: response regulator, partial [Verrucomicrobiales bacterium]|nr:response regulator [Verrucomicrobiales bacterium]